MTLDLTKKTAIVCGSTQGIGLAIAKVFAEQGATVIRIARSEENLIATAGELSHPKNHSYLVADFTKPDMLREVLKKLPDEIHILVNNTGGPPGGPIAEAELSSFTKTFEQHLLCNHILAQAVIPKMKAAKYGRIINIISTSVKQPLKGLGVSNTIRAAVAGWAKTLSFELAPFGITVNNILPGATSTQRLSTLIAAKSEKTGKKAEDLEREMIAEIPMNRFALPEEIAYAAAFLASPAASYITGINIPVDGGRTGCL